MRPVSVVLIVAAVLPFLLACTGPRSITHTSKVTPRGDWRVGGGMSGNVPTQTSKALYGGLENGVKALWEQSAGGGEVPITADSLNDLARAAIAYSVDPLGTNVDFFVRYGVFDRLDLGYKWASGVHVFDGMVQFMGTADAGRHARKHAGPGVLSAQSGTGGMSGSIGVQYSSQSFEMPSYLYLDRLQKLLRFELNRKDILIPLVFGHSLGDGGRFGSLAYGLAYNYTALDYGFSPLKIVERMDDGITRPIQAIHDEKSFSAYGSFFNFRLGYGRVFLVGAFSAYFQDYGSYAVFGGRETSLGGWTFIPALGLEFRI